MSELKCPGCGDPMTPVKSPDMVIDECGRCGGTWLDPGELNALATGLAGDIELCTADHAIHREGDPDRQCPRCDEPMDTVSLLGYADLVFDHCRSCFGFYLDKGEVEAMNEHLRAISRSEAGDEFRGEIGGQLVRVDRQTAVTIRHDALGLSYAAVEEQTLTITVFFAAPLGIGLRVHPERLSARVAKALHLFAPPDIQLDDKEFDRRFLVQGDDAEAVKRAIDFRVRKRLLQLVEDPPAIFAAPGTVEILDDRIVYTEGPYLHDQANPLAPGLAYDAEADPKGIVTALRRIAKAVDESRD